MRIMGLPAPALPSLVGNRLKKNHKAGSENKGGATDGDHCQANPAHKDHPDVDQQHNHVYNTMLSPLLPIRQPCIAAMALENKCGVSNGDYYRVTDHNDDRRIDQQDSQVKDVLLSQLRQVSKSSIATILQTCIRVRPTCSHTSCDAIYDAVTQLIHGPASNNALLHNVTSFPFFLIDVGRVMELLMEWFEMLPRVRPFYAVKCNTQPAFLETLVALGIGFDCASKEEIRKMSGLGVRAADIVFANACKIEEDIHYAAEMALHLSTFDSKEELRKVKARDPNAKLLLRIATDDEGATIPLSSKYGARLDEAYDLLQEAQQVGLWVVGVAFHVGSGAVNHISFLKAISDAHHVFEIAATHFRQTTDMHILDIGGGFCSHTTSHLVKLVANEQSPRLSIQNKNEEEEGGKKEAWLGGGGGGIPVREAASVINQALDKFFPTGSRPGLRIIAEPGRYFADSPFTLVTRVFGKRVRGDIREYWINDGAHGSFTMVLLPHKTRVPHPIPLACKSNPNNVACRGMPLFSSNVFGPTCSSLDHLLKHHPLPELEVGDFMAFPGMGAYTQSLATHFNGFSVADIPGIRFIKTTD